MPTLVFWARGQTQAKAGRWWEEGTYRPLQACGPCAGQPPWCAVQSTSSARKGNDEDMEDEQEKGGTRQTVGEQEEEKEKGSAKTGDRLGKSDFLVTGVGMGAHHHRPASTTTTTTPSIRSLGAWESLGELQRGGGGFAPPHLEEPAWRPSL